MRHIAQLKPSRFLMQTAAVALLAVVAICLLPHSRFIRFHRVVEPPMVKAGWIYDRIHADPTPIDVVFVGTSRTVFDVDSRAVEQSAAAAGVPLHVVNFALQHPGRDMTWLLSREVLLNRPVKLLVIEVEEEESRALHPAFGQLAGVGDLLGAPLFVNTSYIPDLLDLPRRQITLFAETLWPRAFGLPRGFDADGYRGPHWDDTEAERGSTAYPIVPAIPRNATHSVAELAAERRHVERIANQRLRLPGPLHRLETRANIEYLRQILRLAAVHDVAVRFLYLPSYGTTSPPVFAALYARHAPTWDPTAVMAPSDLWLDVNHLNHAGSEALSTWLGRQIAQSGLD